MNKAHLKNNNPVENVSKNTKKINKEKRNIIVNNMMTKNQPNKMDQITCLKVKPNKTVSNKKKEMEILMIFTNSQSGHKTFIREKLQDNQKAS